MDKIEVLGSPFSNFVRSIRMALAEKGVAYTLNPCRPHTPEVDAIHPLGKIPCFKHGDFVLCESKAIATYIDHAFPGPKLFPDEAQAAALVEQWVSLLNTTLIPAMQAYMLGYYFPRTPDGSPNRVQIDGAFPQTETYLKLLDRVVGATGFLAGDSFSFADIDVLPVLAYLKGLPESGAVFATTPTLTAYLDTHSKRPSFIASEPPPFEEFRAAQAAQAKANPAPAAE